MNTRIPSPPEGLPAWMSTDEVAALAGVGEKRVRQVAREYEISQGRLGLPKSREGKEPFRGEDAWAWAMSVRHGKYIPHKAKAALKALKRYAANRGVSISKVHLKGMCPELYKDHEAKERYVAHAFHHPNAICVHPAMDDLEMPTVAGIIAHEVGHVMSGVDDEGSAEPAADQWVLDNLGLDVRYRPGDTLQFLDDVDMDKLQLR